MRFLLLLLLLSCSAEHKATRAIRKADRLLRKAELLSPGVTRQDTVFVHVAVPIVRWDTVLRDRNLIVLDTVVLKSHRFDVRLIPVHDSVRVEVDCRPDTLRVPVQVIREIECPPKRSRWEVWVFLIFLSMLSGFALGVRRR
jgi:hypothetical protein